MGRAHSCRRQHAEQWNAALLLQISDDGRGAFITQHLIVGSVPRGIRVARHLDHVGVDLLRLGAQRLQVLLAFRIHGMTVDGEIDGRRRLHVIVAEFAEALAESGLFRLVFLNLFLVGHDLLLVGQGLLFLGLELLLLPGDLLRLGLLFLLGGLQLLVGRLETGLDLVGGVQGAGPEFNTVCH